MTHDPPDIEQPETPGASQPQSAGTSFLLLAIALLVLAGGAAYLVGGVLTARSKTDAAQASAEAQVDAFDSSDFASEFGGGSSPSSLPLVDDAPDEPPSSIIPELQSSTTTTVPTLIIDPDEIALAFINRVPGDEYGFVGYIDPSGERHLSELECSRLDLNENGGICLAATSGLGGSGRGLLLDSALRPTIRFGVNKPSRAAASPDGAVVAWTGFTLGHSYLTAGEFATTTQLISVERGIGANLESDFTTFWDDGLYAAVDRNYWGVTFVNSDHFFATMGSAGKTVLVEGHVSNSRLDVVVENATCPEVSPDGRTLVAKERRGDHFQVVAIDVATGVRRDLGETRSVADQVEWADDDTVLYALPNPEEGTEAQPVFDIWALDIEEGAEPRLLIPFADSPAA